MRQWEVNVTITEAKIECSWQPNNLRIELTKQTQLLIFGNDGCAGGN